MTMFVSKHQGGGDSSDFAKAAFEFQQQQARQTPPVDVEVQREGTIFLFCVQTAAACEWVEDNVRDPLWSGCGLVVEFRYACEIASAMTADGLRLR
jgi:hypothetical protein